MRMWMKLACVLAALGLGACDKNHTVYALTSTGKLVGFNTKEPTKLDVDVSLSGLATDVSLVQIQYLPSTGTLYGLTSDNKLVTINPTSGAVSTATTSSFISTTPSNPVSAFDPVAGQLRYIATDTNLRVTSAGVLADTGTAVTFDSGDTNDGESPQLSALAYSNPVSGASSSTLYALDVTTQSLLRVGDADVSATASVDEGLLHTIGATGVSFTANSALAIAPDGGRAYAALAQSGAASQLYDVDLGSGAATRLDAIGDGDLTVISLAVEP